MPTTDAQRSNPIGTLAPTVPVPAPVPAWRAYVRIARPDHWTKNVLMIPGIAVALSYRQSTSTPTTKTLIALGVMIAATCLVASSNYVLNELLDAATDKYHPHKSARPAVSGAIVPALALAEWLILALAGFALAFAVNRPVGISAVALWVMGILYNVPPIRLKDWAYLDVLSESANNPIRLALGWFALLPDRLPPFSLVLAYWMAGAFLMAVKRLSEYRELSAHGPTVAGTYRRSFEAYSEQKLLVSSIFYATLGAQFGGMFIFRYRLELVLLAPFIAGLFAWYMHIAYKPESATQHPERLYRERALSGYLTVCLLLFALLMFVRIPWLYEWFTVEPATVAPFWEI